MELHARAKFFFFLRFVPASLGSLLGSAQSPSAAISFSGHDSSVVT